MLMRVDTEDVIGTKYIRCNNFAPHPSESLRHVSEVVFPLGIAGIDLIERIPKVWQFEDITARVDLFERAFLGCVIAFFDNPKKTAGRITEDPTETHWIVHDGGAK